LLHRCARRGFFSKHRIEILFDCQSIASKDAVALADEYQLAGFALALGDIDDFGLLANRLADAQRRMHGETAARPHAPRQGHRRQETSLARQAIGVKRIACIGGGEPHPVPSRRHLVARLGVWVAAAQGSMKLMRRAQVR
jgi:hypothetical protein